MTVQIIPAHTGRQLVCEILGVATAAEAQRKIDYLSGAYNGADLWCSGLQ